MRYESRPHSVEAFRFTGPDIKPPKWFADAVHTGRASVTINAKDQYITLCNTKHEVERAYIGSWVCMNCAGKLFRISDEEFRNSYYL